MNIFWQILYGVLFAVSLLPFWILHRFSDFLYVLAYYVLKYRRKVVRENLCNAFPEKSLNEIIIIEKKFYQGFCDLVIETIKSFSISKTELQKRFFMTTHGNTYPFFDQNINIMGAAAHLGNWEWLNFASALEMKHNFYGIYKPLNQVYFNHLLTKNRARFKTNLLATKSLKLIYEELTKCPYGIAVVADQAPHYYPKALVVNFLNQRTYAVPGPGLMVAQKGMLPIWAWVKRIGRSQYEWGLDFLDASMPVEGFSKEDEEQVLRIAEQYQLSRGQAVTTLCVTKDFYKKLEEKIKMAPQDWLWSHRRWKSR